MTADLSSVEFGNLRHAIQQLCGLVLGEEKQYLVRQRLGPLLARHGLRSFGDLHRQLAVSGNEALKRDVIEAMTTNETSFFRDGHPFQAFSEAVLPEMVQRYRERRNAAGGLPQGKLRIWSAAASAGQEPYSIAILLEEYVKAHYGYQVALENFEILGTDISPEMVARCQEGLYSDLEVGRGLSPERKAAYFVQEGRSWRIEKRLRAITAFKALNLTKPLTHLGKFDMIFCRNVLIYFDEEAKRSILQQMHYMLNPDGALFIGSSESMPAPEGRFRLERHGLSVVYRRV